MKAEADYLHQVGVARVVFTGPTPHWVSFLPTLVMRKLWIDTPERTRVGVNLDVVADNEKLKAAFPQSEGMELVDVMAPFCNSDGCLTRIGQDRMTGITTYDYGHLTPVASDYLAKQVLVERIVGTRAPATQSGL